MENTAVRTMTDEEVMLDLACQVGSPIDLVETVAGGSLELSIEDFDPASEDGLLLSALDSMIPDDTPILDDDEF